MTDTEFIARLHAHLFQFSEGRPPVVPLVWQDGGWLDREETLRLPCYAKLAAETPTG